MKIALCLHGYFNNKADSNSGRNGFEYITETIFKNCDVDVFIHSWEPDKEWLFKKIYKPLAILTEEQKDFSQKMEQNGVDEGYFNSGGGRIGTIFQSSNIAGTLSFLYSRKISIELAQKNKYDCVIAARFDLGQRDKNQQRK